MKNIWIIYLKTFHKHVIQIEICIIKLFSLNIWIIYLKNIPQTCYLNLHNLFAEVLSKFKAETFGKWSSGFLVCKVVNNIGL